MCCVLPVLTDAAEDDDELLTDAANELLTDATDDDAREVGGTGMLTVTDDKLGVGGTGIGGWGRRTGRRGRRWRR